MSVAAYRAVGPALARYADLAPVNRPLQRIVENKS